MNRKHAFILSFLITGLIASNVYLLSLQKENPEQVIVERVIDGDTIHLQDARKIRLNNINAPEKNFHGYESSSNFLKQFENKSLELQKQQLDKYSRILGKLYIPETNEYLNLKIVQQGYANKFLVEENEKQLFAKAEDQAILQEKGNWKKSPHYNCFNSQIDKKKEIIQLTNTCLPINIKDWILKDESRKNYKFQDIIIGTGTIIVHTSNGTDNSTDIFWNSETNIWNDDADTLYLFDKDGNIAHHETYGY